MAKYPEDGYIPATEVLTLIYGAIPVINANEYMKAKWNKGKEFFTDIGYAGHILLAQCYQESKWNYLAQSDTGAKGLWQFTQIAWDDIPRITGWDKPPNDVKWDKWGSTLQAVAKMGYHLARAGGNWTTAQKVYNGASASEQAGYIKNIAAYYKKFYSAGDFATWDTEVGGAQLAFDNRSEFK